MPKRFNPNVLVVPLMGLGFIVIVVLIRSNQLNTGIMGSPKPLPSSMATATSSPSTSTAPQATSPVSVLASPATSVTGPTITSPSNNSKVTSPLTVTGIVPAGWMFEGSFPIKLLNKQRDVIVQGVAKEIVPGSWHSGKAIEFAATLEFSTDEKSGFLILEKDNPSGLPENDESYQIPVKFIN